ncbi:MAG: hypothetical protein ABI142_11410, partial [Bryocella sp.]
MHSIRILTRSALVLALIVGSAISYAQAPTADEIHWTITGNTSVTFDWRGAATEIHYGRNLPYSDQSTATQPSPMPFSSAGPFQQAALSELKPDTVYHYAIGDSPDQTFRTPPRHGSSGFTVAAEGDIGSSVHYKGIIPVQAMVAALKPSFALLLGDLTYAHPNGQRDVDQHFNDVMSWSRQVAYMPAWGNHEWSTPKEDDLRNYKGRFDLPNPQTT